MTFKQWMREVDEIVSSKVGLSVRDLADMNFRDAYDGEVSPADFVSDTVREHIQEDYGNDYATLLD